MKKIVSIISVVLLSCVIIATLVACIPTDAEKAYANLLDEGYQASIMRATDSPETEHNFHMTANGLIIMVRGFKAIVEHDPNSTGIVEGEQRDQILIYYFETNDQAKAFYEANKERVDYYQDNYGDLREIGKSGKIVYIGTPNAIKAAQ